MIPGFVVLFAALASATWIDVPFIRQEKQGCGSASVWMIMQYWGKSPGPPEDIHRILFSKEAGGVFAADIETFLKERGFRTIAFAGEWSDLVENVSKGRPLLVTIEANARGTPLHYVLVAGVDEAQQIVLINDPARRKLLPLTRAEFEHLWEAMNRWTLLAVPEEEPAAPAHTVRPSPPSQPEDSPLETASLAFRAGHYAEAKRSARKSANQPLRDELLATVYFLENNLEAAIKYWNRNESPRIREVGFDAESRWSLVLLDHTMGISRATLLDTSQYVLARKRLDATETFSRYSLDLSPTGDEEFDLSLRAAERPLWNPIGWVRGLPFETVSPEFNNIGGLGLNIAALWRWDVNKRRVKADVSGIMAPGARFIAGIDARRETWDVQGQIIPIRRDDLHFGLRSIATPKWTWSSGATVIRRPASYSLKYTGSADYDLLRLPERKVFVTAGLAGQFGRTFSSNERLRRAEGRAELKWFPQASGEDLGVLVRARTGRVWGDVPVDELFSVGIDRDETLTLRGHPNLKNGRKGAGLIGRRYVLVNSEFSKTVFEAAFFRASIVPFADIARMGGVFVDAGAELRISLASILTFSVSVGRDLKGGRTAVFTNVSR